MKKAPSSSLSRPRYRIAGRASASVAALVGIVAATASAVSAQNILYFNDLNIGTDRMAQALAGLGPGYTVFSTNNTTTFTTQLGTGTYDLAIFFQQNSSGVGYDTAFTALDAHVAGGGAAIATDWTRNLAHADGFGASYAANVNQTVFTIADPTLATSIVNPVTLANPGWGTFSTGLNGAGTVATFANGQGAIVVGNGGRTILNGFLSDTFADGAEGAQLYRNEIGYVLGAGVAPVPEPGAVAFGVIMGGGLLGLVVRGRRRTGVTTAV